MNVVQNHAVAVSTTTTYVVNNVSKDDAVLSGRDFNAGLKEEKRKGQIKDEV